MSWEDMARNWENGNDQSVVDGSRLYYHASALSLAEALTRAVKGLEVTEGATL